MKLSKTPLRTVLLVLLLTGAAAAAPVRWYLKDVTFNDGGGATGYFTIQGGGSYSQAFIDYYIVTTPGNAMPGRQYSSAVDPDPAFYSALGGSGNFLDFGQPGFFHLSLTSGSNLTVPSNINAGTAPLIAGQETGNGRFRNYASGYLTTQNPAVPEPASLLLAGLGCAGLLAVRARRRS